MLRSLASVDPFVLMPLASLPSQESTSTASAQPEVVTQAADDNALKVICALAGSVLGVMIMIYILLLRLYN